MTLCGINAPDVTDDQSLGQESVEIWGADRMSGQVEEHWDIGHMK